MYPTARTDPLRALGLAAMVVLAAIAGSSVGTALRDLVRDPTTAVESAPSAPAPYPDFGLRHAPDRGPVATGASLTRPSAR